MRDARITIKREGEREGGMVSGTVGWRKKESDGERGREMEKENTVMESRTED